MPTLDKKSAPACMSRRLSLPGSSHRLRELNKFFRTRLPLLYRKRYPMEGAAYLPPLASHPVRPEAAAERVHYGLVESSLVCIASDLHGYRLHAVGLVEILGRGAPPRRAFPQFREIRGDHKDSGILILASSRRESRCGKNRRLVQTSGTPEGSIEPRTAVPPHCLSA